MTIADRYYELVDAGEAAKALELVSPSLVFCLARPEQRIEGTSRDDLGNYMGVRPARSHRLNQVVSSGNVDLVLGESVEDGRSLGTFIAALRSDGSGRIDRYVASFYPDLSF
jgi:hypothetical protein